MAFGIYPSQQTNIFGSSGDLPGAIDASHHATGFPVNVQPNRKQLNQELNRLDGGMLYLLQGLPEFTVGQQYAAGRIVTDGTKLYKSLANQTAAAGDLLDTTKWALFFDSSLTYQAVATSANTTSAIGLNDLLTETQSTGQNITLFDCTLVANASSKFKKYQLKVAHDNVTVTVTGGGNITGVPSRTFNSGDWVIFINNGTEWFIGS